MPEKPTARQLIEAYKATHAPVDGKTFTNEEIRKGIRLETGVVISMQRVYQIIGRTGSPVGRKFQHNIPLEEIIERRKAGKSIKEIAKELGVKMHVIIGHIKGYMKEGHEIRPSTARRGRRPSEESNHINQRILENEARGVPPSKTAVELDRSQASISVRRRRLGLFQPRSKPGRPRKNQ